MRTNKAPLRCLITIMVVVMTMMMFFLVAENTAVGISTQDSKRGRCSALAKLTTETFIGQRLDVK
jgi:hypothetical protein